MSGRINIKEKNLPNLLHRILTAPWPDLGEKLCIKCTDFSDMNEVYDTIGTGYAVGRRTDPVIASQICQYLQRAEMILNIGAGTGSYEPKGYPGIAVEPSSEMIAQRHSDAFPVIKASAESLPFEDNAFSHSMTVLSMHHWSDRKAAFGEIKRVTRQRFVAVTWDPESSPFWLTRDYFPELYDADAKIFPSLSELFEAFPKAKVLELGIPENCIDGFLAAYWKRPEAYLIDKIRSCMSTFQKIANIEEGLQKLGEDLATGAWRSKNQDILHKDTIDAGYRIFVADMQNT